MKPEALSSVLSHFFHIIRGVVMGVASYHNQTVRFSRGISILIHVVIYND